MIRLLIINTQGLRREGITSTIISTLDYMKKDDIEISLAIVGDSDYETLNHLSELGCKLIKLKRRKGNTIAYFIELVRLCKVEKYDIIHIHGSSSLISLELMAAYLGGIKKRIAHCHNTQCSHEFINAILKPVLNLLATDRFACGNEAGKWMFGRHQFRIVHNGKNLSDYEFNPITRKKMRDSYGVSNSLVLGHVGNFNYQKNHEFIIDMFVKLSDRNDKWKLVLVGEGENLPKIKKMVTENHLDDKVIFAGSVSNVSDYLQLFDVAILPSRFEGLPVVAIEYQASGLPVLMSSNITKECAPTELVTFLNLEDDKSKWIDSIRIFDEKTRKDKSLDACNILRNKGYDIREVSVNLLKYYIQMYKGETNEK